MSFEEVCITIYKEIEYPKPEKLTKQQMLDCKNEGIKVHFS